MAMPDKEFYSDITPISQAEFGSILTVLSHDWEGEEKGDIDHKLLDYCLYLEEKVEWLEKQLKQVTTKGQKRSWTASGGFWERLTTKGCRDNINSDQFP